MKDNQKNKTNIILLIISLCISLSLIAAGTYAAWIWQSPVNKDVVFNTSKSIQEYIVYDEGDSKFIGNFQPTSTFCEGQYLTFSIYKQEEIADVTLMATIYMDVNSIGTNMAASSNVYWILTEGDSSITCSNGLNTWNVINYASFAETDTSNTITLTSELEITTTLTNYTVWIWIDNSGNNSSLSGETLDVNIWTQIDMLPTDRKPFIVPEGATYTTNISGTYCDDYTNAVTYSSGDIVDFEPSTCDKYVYGDYYYYYNAEGSMEGIIVNEDINGWGVDVKDGMKTSYGEILTSINGKDVVSLSFTFSGTAIVTAPTIPSTITNMYRTFYYCEDLTGTIEINANPIEYGGAFEDTSQPIKLTGTSTMLDELADTADYGNVSILGLITFTIGGTEYHAEEGMTWGEWIESDYNINKIYSLDPDDEYLVYNTVTNQYVGPSIPQNMYDTISDGFNYTLQ